MAVIEIELRKDGRRAGRIVYELEDPKFGFGHVVSVQHENPGLENVLEMNLTGNPMELLLKSHPVDEIAATFDGLAAVLSKLAERDPSFGYDLTPIRKNQPTYDAPDGIVT